MGHQLWGMTMTKLLSLLGVVLISSIMSASPAQALSQPTTDAVVNDIVTVVTADPKPRQVVRVLKKQTKRLEKRPDYETVRIILKNVQDVLQQCSRHKACGNKSGSFKKALLSSVRKLQKIALESKDPEIRAFYRAGVELEKWVRAAPYFGT